MKVRYRKPTEQDINNPRSDVPIVVTNQGDMILQELNDDGLWEDITIAPQEEVMPSE